MFGRLFGKNSRLEDNLPPLNQALQKEMGLSCPIDESIFSKPGLPMGLNTQRECEDGKKRYKDKKASDLMKLKADREVQQRPRNESGDVFSSASRQKELEMGRIAREQLLSGQIPGQEKFGKGINLSDPYGIHSKQAAGKRRKSHRKSVKGGKKSRKYGKKMRGKAGGRKSRKARR